MGPSLNINKRLKFQNRSQRLQKVRRKNFIDLFILLNCSIFKLVIVINLNSSFRLYFIWVSLAGVELAVSVAHSLAWSPASLELFWPLCQMLMIYWLNSLQKLKQTIIHNVLRNCTLHRRTLFSSIFDRIYWQLLSCPHFRGHTYICFQLLLNFLQPEFKAVKGIPVCHIINEHDSMGSLIIG